MSSAVSNVRSVTDRPLAAIADYVVGYRVTRSKAYACARYCLMDSLGCAFEALGTPDCIAHLGPLVPGTIVPYGARVPGTQYQLDPVTAAFNIGCAIRWLDFNDTWWAGGHPSDNIGGVLAVADYISRRNLVRGGRPLLMRDLLAFMVKIYEIHCLLQGANPIDQPDVGLDPTLFVKVATTAVATHMLGGSREEIINALSNAFVDGQCLNIFRRQPHTGPRKSWAAADATSRGVRLALMAVAGEMGYPSALSAKTWGFQAVFLDGKSLKVPPSFGSHVIENTHFKLAFPAQRHAQSAAECAVVLHPEVKSRLNAIQKITIWTHALTIETINITGPLASHASRDHCLQYIVAVALIYGEVTTDSYTDEFAAVPLIDVLRARIEVLEDPAYTKDYHDPRKRCNANALRVFFTDGSSTRKVAVDYPIGDSHRRQRDLPLLEEKFKANLARRFPAKQKERIFSLLSDQNRLEHTPVNECMDLLSI